MHLLHIISTLDPAAGGVSEGVRLLLSQRDAGSTGEAVTLDAPDAPFLQDLPFPVHALGRIQSTYGYSPRLYPWLRTHRDRFDGMIVHGMWQYCGLATMLAARGTPYLVFAHGMLDPYFKRRFPRKHIKKAVYWYPVEYWVLRMARRVIFTTDTERALAEESFALWTWRPAIVPFGLLPPAESPASLVEAFHAVVPGLRNRRFLLFLGRIHPKKGCDLLAQAFCEVAASDPELHLVMAGPDADGWVPELQAVVANAGLADRVHWPGMLRDGAKWGAFLASEAFVLPSHQENFGIAVAEALACGRAVLLSDQVNIGPMIKDAGCALIEPDTLEGTQNLLRRWMALSAEERGTMGRMADLCFRTTFDLRESVRAIDRLVQESVQDPAGGRRP